MAIHQEEPTPAEGFGRILISSRSLDEYRAMFELTDGDLRRRILDCPSGAAEFTAEICRLGGDAIACDSAYFDNGIDKVAATAVAEAERGNRYVHANRHLYRWTFFADPDQHRIQRQRAAERFVAHTRQSRGRYVAGRLPALPFPDNDFDLVLSSHLLFSYAEELDYDFHLHALLELMRVTRGELRVFPLVSIGTTARYPHLNELLVQLRRYGIAGRITEVDYEFQVGGNEMLVCRRLEGMPTY
ncbi:class I SAM-dependent methyltransferase [Nocardia sp. 004]|uniref:class I SAM-dependent methyltransferase n=1 Tax=Nocardia sp. 004 TaxID=3385978 RepID=UPI00399F1D7F